ncbi:hypothetical protein ACSFBX_29430 [Variovorax sp. RB2P76]|uniref:hypothetical protein n=1 Tax=Variovorax sp. RB2P76 TaxID=3443736 RepID=UPI003F44F098
MEFKQHERISDRHLTGETIRIGDDWAASVVRCRLDKCHIVIDVPRGGPGIYDSRLTNCTIETKRRLKDSQGFMHASYIQCKFLGKFAGMDFGRSPWPNTVTANMTEHGELLDCDFTEATLDLCRFFNADVTQQTFAPWPQFLVPADRRMAAMRMEHRWPGKLAGYVRLSKDQNPALTASTGTVADFTKRFGISDKELQEALRIIGGVLR